MSKKVLLKEGRQKLAKGIKLLNDAVVSTLGPSGMSVIIRNGMEEPFITKDGVTVAKSIESDDEVEMAGIMLIRKASTKMDEDSGDGTTTATLLCSSMIERGFADNIVDVVSYKRGMITAQDRALAYLEESKRIIDYSDLNMLTKVATISANNDKKLGKMVAEAVSASGRFGKVNVMASLRTYSEIVKTEGYAFDLGFADASFINDVRTGSFICDRKSLLILYKGQLTDKNEWLQLADMAMEKNQSITIIAEDYSSDIRSVLAPFANQRLKSSGSTAEICLIKNPMREIEYKNLFEDLSAYTGAITVTKIDKYMTEYGEVSKIQVKPGVTILGESLCDIDYHIEALKDRMAADESDYEKEECRKRISRLEGSVVTLFIGANSDVEAKELMDRAVDATNACKLAADEGIVIGGGQVYLSIPEISFLTKVNEDYKKGFNNVMVNLQKPFEQIYKNCKPAISKEEMLAELSSKRILSPSYGYDMKKHEYCDLFESGVVDPLPVVKNSLINAVSVASTVLTTECVIVEKINHNG